MRAPCELCGFPGPMKPYYPACRILQCPQCDLVFYDGAVNASLLYDAAYFAGGEYLDYAGDKRVLQRNFQASIRALRRIKPSGRLLEIGTAHGFFLELAQEYWEVSGVDLASEAVQSARQNLKLNVQAADFLDLPETPGSYDVICLWDTLEHLAHPVRVIEKAGRSLKPGGVLALTTGDIGSRVARWRRELWRQIHPPTHLYYFSEKTLRDALSRAGLQIYETRYKGYSRSWKSMMHGIFALRKSRRSWMYPLMTLGGRLDFPLYLNLHDIRWIVGVKSSSS